MALTRTTLSGAIGINDTVLRVASATGFLKGELLRVDDEMMMTTEVSGTNISVLRGQNASVNKAHANAAGVVTGTAEEFAGSAITVISYPLAGRQRRVSSYSATGAITLPSPGTDEVAILNGTGTLVMTVAAPTLDMDGCKLTIFGNGKSSSTIQFDGTVGLGNAGSSYDIITLQNAGNVGIEVMAINGFWNVASAPAITGTTTAIGVAVA